MTELTDMHILSEELSPFTRLIDNINILSMDENYNKIPIFFYMGIGSANNDNKYPEPDNRQEFPDYISEYSFINGFKKIIILIDPLTKGPLEGSGIEFKLFDSIKNTKSDVPYNTNIYEHFISTNTDSNGYPTIDIHILREYIQLDENIWNPETSTHIRDREFIKLIVEISLKINPKSLFLINSFTGYSYYKYQDIILSMFPYEYHDDFRNRFLIEGTYFAYHGCRYDLTNQYNQPIIENGKFYNPGSLSFANFDIELVKLFQSENVTDSITFIKKKQIMMSIFNVLLKDTLNEEYRMLRNAINENTNDFDADFKQFLREEMLLFVKNILQTIKSFLNIDKFIEKQRIANIYSDEYEIKKVISELLHI
jgi:hypothetical protein